MTQTTELIRTKAAITIEIARADAPNHHKRPKIIIGGSEPHVPGATGRYPSPKHDVKSLFIVVEGYMRTAV
jgi:hypothetical protein